LTAVDDRAAPAPELEPSVARVAPHEDPDAPPVLLPGHLDALWFQLTGTLCNLRCRHCFISCAPDNREFGFLSRDEVGRRLDEAATLGVRETYFTGGEPFLHPEIVEILAASLERFPTTVLTNGIPIKRRHAEALAAAASASPYSLEVRLSIDGFDAETNDAIRGPGAFDRAMRGLDALLAHGFLPLVTAVRTWEDDAEPAVYEGFLEALRARGYARPRVKLLPTLKLGAEVERAGGYRPHERVTAGMMEGFDPAPLVCAGARVVTDRGIWVCPILLDAPGGNLGDDLAAAAAAPFRLSHSACHTCWLHGAICANPGAAIPETGARA
jgi:uncharacterized Fe-S cluster-containing radical SAM superfamily protein